MATLRINYIGELPGTPPSRTMLVAKEADYCTAAAELRRDLAGAYDAIWVRQEHHYAWLQAFVDHFGIGLSRAVEFAKTTARDQLAARWGLSVPEWLTDELILAEKLLDRDLPPGTHESVASVLLAPWIGSLSATFPRAQAGVLAQTASAPAMQAGLAGSVLAREAWKNTVSSWGAAASSSWVSEFCERLLADPNKLWCDLTVWRLLRNYPPAQLEFALDPAAVTFVRTVPIDVLKEMSVDSDGRALALDQIQPLFEQARAATVMRPKFDALLAAVSGELKEEFEGLEALLATESFKIERTDVDSIARRFKSCSDIGLASLAKLELYVRPPVPDGIDSTTADAATWVKWFHAQYLPYRWWQTQRIKNDASVEETVGAFSDWYCRDFIKVHSDPSISAVQTLTQWRSAILKDSVSLILLVDNLSWFFWESFERALATAGLYKHESQSRFVPLPSHTSVCKPDLVLGRWDATGSDYLGMLEVRSSEEWGNRPVQYLAGVDQLATVKEFGTPTVLLLNYLAGDEALHADSGAAGTTPTEQLVFLYKSLATAIVEFARRASQGGRMFGLYVLTDHGSTCVLPDERKSADALLVKRLFPNEKYRSASVPADAATEIPENIWALGHRFLNPCHKDGMVHFIPRGHSTVASPGPRLLYSHGGAVPEEVIVPSAVFRLYRAAWVEPSVRFLNLKLKDGRALFYVKRIANVEVEIQNTNRDECRLESVSIEPSVGEIRNYARVVTAPNSVGNSVVSLYFGASATATQTLAFTFAFRIAQETLIRRVELPVAISSAATGGTDLTNLLP